MLAKGRENQEKIRATQARNPGDGLKTKKGKSNAEKRAKRKQMASQSDKSSTQKKHRPAAPAQAVYTRGSFNPYGMIKKKKKKKGGGRG